MLTDKIGKFLFDDYDDSTMGTDKEKKEEDHVMTADEIDALFEDDYSERVRAAADASNKRKEERKKNYTPLISCFTMADSDDPAMNGYDLKSMIIKTEELCLGYGKRGTLIVSGIWNNSVKKIAANMDNSYIINAEKEQHNLEYPYSGYSVTNRFSIHSGAHLIKGDVFTYKISGTPTPGWVYGLEMTDRTNHKAYDVQFMLGNDWKWRYANIDVSDSNY